MAFEIYFNFKKGQTLEVPETYENVFYVKSYLKIMFFKHVLDMIFYQAENYCEFEDTLVLFYQLIFIDV